METHDDLIAEVLKQPNPFIPAGEYLLEHPLVIPPGVYLKGAGQGKTFVGLTPSTGEDPRWAVIGLSSGSKLSDISVASEDACTNGVVADGIRDFLIYKVSIRCQLAHTYWIWSHNSSNGTIDSCEILGTCTNPDNSIGQEGIEVFGGDNISVQNNHISCCGRSGIILYQDNQAILTNVKIYNNVVESCSLGIFLSAGLDCRITNAHIRGNQVHKSGLVDMKIAGATGSIINALFEENSYKSLEVNTAETYSTKVVISS